MGVSAVTVEQGTGLELDDIQIGALHERPSPYVGTYLLLRIDDRAAGRALVRRLLPLVDSGRSTALPEHGAWITVAFTYTGLKALGVPQESLDSFAPEFQQGMAARAAELGDVGESDPSNWEAPLGTSDVHVAVAVLSPDAAAAGGRRGEGASRAQGAGRCRVDLAAGLLPAPERAHVVRLQGRHRPAGGRRKRHAVPQREGAAAQGR